MFSRRTNWSLEPNKLSEVLGRHRTAAKPLLDLTASNPTKCGFRYDADAIRHALANPRSLAYEPEAQGLEAARRAVAAYYAERGHRVAIEDIILTTSTSEAYSFIFRLLCDPGDEILVPAPSYPLFEFLADLEDVKLVRYPLIYEHGWQIDFATVDRVMTPRTHALIVVHPNNPTGHFCSLAETAELNKICARRELAAVVDEVFLDFSLNESAPRTFAANSEVLTFTLSGLSKIAGLPQMKLAWLVVSGPAAMKAQALARLGVTADTYLSMNAPVEHAALVLLEQRRAFQPQLMERVRWNLAELDDQLAAQKSCSRLQMQGGWYAVVRVPRTRSDEELAIELLTREGVYVHPGHFYDFPTEGYFVVSLITPHEEFARGIHALLEIFA